ncbi:hypothetical protein Tco_0854047 [Tanacetum coccineum]
MHEDFIATVYPKVHEILKHVTEEHVFLKNPPSSSRTLSSMKNLDDAFTYGDQFLNYKPTEEEPGKANMEIEVESMVTVPIHQSSSSVPPLSTPVIDLTPPKPVSDLVQEPVLTATTATTATTTTLPLPPPLQQQSIIDPELANRVSALEEIYANLGRFIEAKAKSCKRRRDEQDPPPPPPKDSYQSKKKRHDSDASALKQPQAQTYDIPKLDWVVPPNDLPETKNNWANVIANAYKDLEENKLIRKTRDMRSFIKWYCKQIKKSKLNKDDLKGPAFKLIRPFHKNNISLQFQMEKCHMLLTDQTDLANPEGNRVVPDVRKPLPLGGLPCQVTIQPQYFFNKDLEYLISGDKERRNALSISKLKAAYYPNFGLEERLPHCGLKVNVNTILVQPTVSHTGGLSARNSTSLDTVPPLIVVQSDFT